MNQSIFQNLELDSFWSSWRSDKARARFSSSWWNHCQKGMAQRPFEILFVSLNFWSNLENYFDIFREWRIQHRSCHFGRSLEQIRLKFRIGDIEHRLDAFFVWLSFKICDSVFGHSYIAKMCLGTVTCPGSQITLLTRFPFLSRLQLRNIRTERESFNSCDIATKLYCPPTPLTTTPFGRVSLIASPNKLICIVVLKNRGWISLLPQKRFLRIVEIIDLRHSGHSETLSFFGR